MQQNPPLEQQRAQQQAPDLQGHTQDALNGTSPLNVMAPYRGWYPRWWLLAAFCCSAVIGLGTILWQPLICRNETSLLCRSVDRFSFFMIIPIWLFFLGLWYVLFVVSVRPVEFPQRGGSPFGSFLRNVSQFQSRRTFIIVQGIGAFLLVNVLWWLNRTTPLAFAMLGIVVFVSHCCIFYGREVNQRRLFLILYAVIALMLLVLEATVRPDFFNHWPSGDEWPLLLTEVFLGIVGIVATIRVLRYRPPAAQTATDAYNQSIDNSVTRWAAMRSVWPFSRLFPVRPVAAANQENDQQQDQPDPQA